jgi:protein-ribulosamine 3-kinase
MFVRIVAEYSAGEYISLMLLHEAVPTLAPRSLAWGKFSSSDTYYLVTEWIDVETQDGGQGPGTGLTLAQKVAKLHTTPAPIPPGHRVPMFGFPIRTYCGSTPQNNIWCGSWAHFFAENRLRSICRIIEQNHGTDNELTELLEQLIKVVVPRLLGNGRLGGKKGIQPVLIHGDLWEGNKAKGRFDDRDGIEHVTFDPACSYAHSEFELALMRMFGGFSAGFFNEYHHLVPKTEPKKEYNSRMELYEL